MFVRLLNYTNSKLNISRKLQERKQTGTRKNYYRENTINNNLSNMMHFQAAGAPIIQLFKCIHM